MSELELLAPAGNLDILKAVMQAGADAVYVGGARFGARAYADNFGTEELLEAIDYGHIHGKKVFLTVNTLLKNNEIENELYDYLLPYYEQGLDAAIIQDLGVLQFVHRHFPKMHIHASTQMTVNGVDSARFLKEQGAARVVTARELSFEEIRAIHDAVDIEIESFVHGALCYCYSGQCLMSSMLGGRSGNRGRCAQPCRLPYTVQDSNGRMIGKPENYILSPKDLCTIDEIPRLAESGIYSFKIEGRMKQVEYAAGVVSMYRKYVDQYEELGTERFKVTKGDMQNVLDFGNRSGFTKGYYVKHNGPDMMTFENPSHAKGNEALLEEIRTKYLNQNLKEKINGILKISKNLPVTLDVEWKNHRVTVLGDLVQQAQKQPMSVEKVEQRMKKTGNTPFVFEQLSIEMDPDAFLPIQSLNQLRRDALEQLVQLELAPFKRAMENDHARTEIRQEIDQTLAEIPKNTRRELTISFETRAGISSALAQESVNNIYLDSSLFTHQNLVKEVKELTARIHAAGKMAGFIMPAVFRMSTRSFYLEQMEALKKSELDYYVVRSLDELQFLKDAGIVEGQLVMDTNMYTYSDWAVAAYTAEGIDRVSVPVELNRKELLHRECHNSEMLIYGYQQLMVSAQCVHKNTTGCDKTRTTLYLKDRYKKEFLVYNNCSECYNTIYNGTPLCLFMQKEDLEQMACKSYRIHFTRESDREVDQILSLYRRVFEDEETVDMKDYLKDYTNGHYKRGVE